MFEELKRLCRHHPFVKVCLHVGLQAEIWARLAAKEEDDDERELEFLLRFLADKFDDINSHGERQKEHSLEQLARWVQLDRNIMAWLPSPPLPAQPRNEISTIASTFKLLRPLLSPHFRHFVIVVPDHCPRKLSRASLEDVCFPSLSVSLFLMYLTLVLLVRSNYSPSPNCPSSCLPASYD